MSPRRALLVAVVIGAAALRLWHYDYDVGHRFTMDASEKVAQAREVARGDLLPLNWRQPYFLPYSAGAIIALTGAGDEASAVRVVTLYMIALALASIVLLDLLCAEVFESRWVGLAAAAMLAVVPVNVIGSRYIKEDIPLLFWCQLSLLLLVQIVRGRWVGHYLLAGLAIGFAVGTKFTGLVLVPFLLLAHLLRARTGEAGRSARDWAWAAGALLLIPLGFLACNPLIVGHLASSTEGVAYQAAYSARGHHDGTQFEPWPAWWTFYLRHALLPGLTWPITLLSLGGIVAVAADRTLRQNRAAWLLAAWCVVLYCLFEASPAKPFPFFVRYVHAIVPPMLALAAALWWRLRSTLRLHLGPRATAVAMASALGALVAWPLTKSVLITAAIGDDTRVQATRYIDEHLPAGSKIALGTRYYSPRPDPGRFRVRYEIDLGATPVEELRLHGFAYAVPNSINADRFTVAGQSAEGVRHLRTYQELFALCEGARQFRPRFAFQSYGFHNPVLTVCPVAPAE
jgi:4-amino-4-deoxy-L-arabinose transferase-like glycosyltransferase